MIAKGKIGFVGEDRSKIENDIGVLRAAIGITRAAGSTAIGGNVSDEITVLNLGKESLIVTLIYR